MLTEREKAIFLLGVDLAARARVPRVVHTTLNEVWFNDDPSCFGERDRAKRHLRAELMDAMMTARDCMDDNTGERFMNDMDIIQAPLVDLPPLQQRMRETLPPDIFNERPVMVPWDKRGNR